MESIKFVASKWFGWVVLPSIFIMIGIGAYFYGMHLLDTSYTTTGIIVGKTIESHSGLFGGYSNEVCIVEYDGKKDTTMTNGCLYNEGDHVTVFVTELGISIRDERHD